MSSAATMSVSTIAKDELIQSLHTQLKQHRNRVISYRLLVSLPAFMLVIAVTYLLSHSLLYCGISAVLMATMLAWRLARSTELADIRLDNFLLHLNRCYPQLEESAQLLTRDPLELNLLQQLQQHKIRELLTGILAQTNSYVSADYSLKRPMVLSVTTAIALIVLSLVTSKIHWQQIGLSEPTDKITAEMNSTLPDGINSVQVTIQPPTYSQLATTQFTELNMSLLAGSQITWQLGFKHTGNLAQDAAQNAYAIELSNGELIALIQQENGLFMATATINQTAIYSLNSPSGKLDGVYTLAVTADSAPQIRFLAPNTTTTEIAKDGLTELKTEVVVTDDFALSQVSIQASIAKGSGEGVKFRDQNFEFDSMQIIAGKAHYFKHWQLTELDMEPGDEMYFSVLAWDNREPEAQLTRSPTKIIRWLEEEQSELVSEGILLDVMPEYFKSQRQIIIETEQLLLAQEQLENSEFKRLSTELGFAQSDLKQKYGQFLGDEFEGATLHNMESGPVHQTEQHDEHDDAEDQDHEKAAQQHEHEAPQSDDKSGASQLIAQFGHNHGETELGFTGFKGQPSPTALMKQAIANMWNAELHLMLSEPAQALPYEKQALKFLTQAKQAERIYVKRLGFEPPPVSESRRYQGELKDIKNAQQQQQSPQIFEQQLLLTASINALQEWLNSSQNEVSLPITAEQQKALKTLLMAGLNSAPDNIQHIATLEKLSAKATQLQQECPSCITQLQQKLWSLLPAVVAAPAAQQNSYFLSNPALTDYQQFLQQEQQQ